jgi:hypothetical protein
MLRFREGLCVSFFAIGKSGVGQKQIRRWSEFILARFRAPRSQAVSMLKTLIRLAFCMLAPAFGQTTVTYSYNGFPVPISSASANTVTVANVYVPRQLKRSKELPLRSRFNIPILET